MKDYLKYQLINFLMIIIILS